MTFLHELTNIGFICPFKTEMRQIYNSNINY